MRSNVLSTGYHVKHMDVEAGCEEICVVHVSVTRKVVGS